MIEGKWNRRQFPRAAGVGAGVLFFGGRLDAAQRGDGAAGFPLSRE
jgi:hypothetical protein